MSAVLGAYLVLLPGARVLTLLGWLLVEVPALFSRRLVPLPALGGQLLILTPELSGGVAFFAHIGGFVFGALTVGLVAQRQPLGAG